MRGVPCLLRRLVMTSRFLLMMVFVILGIQGAACASPQISVPAASIHFSTVSLGSTSGHSLCIKNTGSHLLAIDEIVVASPFTAALSGPMTIGVMDSVTVGIFFLSTDSVTYVDTLKIVSNASNVLVLDIAIMGEGVRTNLTISPGELAFGTLEAGDTRTSTLSFTN